MFMDLSNGIYDLISTTYDGVLEGVRGIRLSNDVNGCSEGVLNVHIDGDPGNVSKIEMEFGRNRVRAMAFANLGHALMRAGYKSQEGSGEVVVVMVLEASVPVSTMARAAITVTEGITSAIQDLGLRYDSISASGSLRQNLVIVRRRDSDVKVRGAGNHCKLGELIGASTIDSVKASAVKNGVDSGFRRSLMLLLSEYGITAEDLKPISGADGHPTDFDKKNSDGMHIASVSAVLHIEDCIRWGLVPKEQGTAAGNAIICSCFGISDAGDDLLDSLKLAVSDYLFG